MMIHYLEKLQRRIRTTSKRKRKEKSMSPSTWMMPTVFSRKSMKKNASERNSRERCSEKRSMKELREQKWDPNSKKTRNAKRSMRKGRQSKRTSPRSKKKEKMLLSRCLRIPGKSINIHFISNLKTERSFTKKQKWKKGRDICNHYETCTNL